MSKQRLDVGAEIHLSLAIPAFPTRAEADALDWSRRITLPPGRYVVRNRGRSESGPRDESHSRGFYYEVDGPGRGWVRHNYLLAGQHEDWPWDLTFCLEPLKWEEAWASYERGRPGAPDEPAPAGSVEAPPEEPLDFGSEVASQADDAEAAAEPTSQGVDEFGVPIADSGDFLPDFDSIFEVEDNEETL